MLNVTDSFLVLPPPGHIDTLEADMVREYVLVLTADNGVTKKLGAPPANVLTRLSLA